MEKKNLKVQAHPWHGISPGEKAPHLLTVYIEMVSLDTVKYEVDKESGHLIVDRPHKYSSLMPALYGFLPQSYCAEKVAQNAAAKTGRANIMADLDPIDIVVLNEQPINHGGVLVSAVPIGGFRMFDGKEIDEKIICVLHKDPVYGDYKEITDIPSALLERLRHYFLTYKEMPEQKEKTVEIVGDYGADEARLVIEKSLEDYKDYIAKLA